MLKLLKFETYLCNFFCNGEKVLIRRLYRVILVIIIVSDDPLNVKR
jgi:hypothetical protein